MVLKLKALFLFTQMGQPAGRCWDRGCVCLEEDLPNKLEMPGGLGGKRLGPADFAPTTVVVVRLYGSSRSCGKAIMMIRNSHEFS